MSISYPLTIPSYTGFRSVDLRMVNAVAVSRSPFTLSTQAHKYAGQMWQADIALPAMDYINGAKWFAWLGSLNGQFGTFLLGDPRRCTARGTATTATISGSAGASSVTVTMTGTLLAGDLGCLLNMSGKLTRLGIGTKVRHVAEVLAGMADGPAIGEPAARGRG